MGHGPVSRSPARRSRCIAVVTGTRAEYGLLTSTMRAIAAHPRLRLQLIVTGMHVLHKFGHTIDTIARDGWHIDARVPMQRGSDSPTDQAEGLGRGVAGIARFLAAGHTDIVVVLGDRIEAMAGALAAATTGCVLAHIQGGDVAPGDFDESLRHAITKLAHIHFPATPAAARRVIRLGERREHVHAVGAVGLDDLRDVLRTERRARGSSGQALVAYHAHGRAPDIEARAMRTVLRAVTAVGLRRLIVYPNSDRGHRGVLHAIAEHACAYGEPAVHVVRSLPRGDYLRHLIHADVLVGNSSSGIIEAPLAGTPSVDVGARQAGRQPGAATVIHVAESHAAVRAGILTALSLPRRPGQRTAYGDGRAAQRIVRILARTPLTPDLTRKTITY